MSRRGERPPTQEQDAVDRVFRSVLDLSPRAQLELFAMLRERLAEVAAPAPEFDETAERQEAAIEAMERVARAAGLPEGQAPTTTQFKEHVAELGLDWSVSTLGRLFKGWSNAQKFYERRRLPETARQVRQRRYLQHPGSGPREHLAHLRQWLDEDPPDTSTPAYEDWRRRQTKLKRGGDAPLPAASQHIRRCLPGLAWEHIVELARDGSRDPVAFCREMAEKYIREVPNPLGIVGAPTASALLELTTTRFQASHRSKRKGFPQPAGRLANSLVFYIRDIRAYRAGRDAPRRPPSKWIELLSSADVGRRVGMRQRAVDAAVIREAWHLVPPPAGVVSKGRYWTPAEVEEWCRQHPARCRK